MLVLIAVSDLLLSDSHRKRSVKTLSDIAPYHGSVQVQDRAGGEVIDKMLD